MDELERRRLGSSALTVSELSLGSWRTFERIPRESGEAVMRKARDVGINFLDDARYNDETGRAPLKTGYSEVVFGELFRAAGWQREEVIVANKLWWEFWPEESAVQEIDASLKRMGMEYLDLAYAAEPPEGMSVDRLVTDVTDLITAGKIRAWGVLNWPAPLIAQAARVASERGLPRPCAAQLPYNLMVRAAVEDPEMVDALVGADMGVVASYTLMGGALSGKYAKPGTVGRVTAQIDERDYSVALSVGNQLSAFAQERGAKPAAMAIAFALINPLVATVLFGATKPEQIEENIGAIAAAREMEERTMAELRLIGG